MKQASTLVILGAGGHGKVVADAALALHSWSRVLATDRNPARCTGELLAGVQLLPLDEALALADAAFHVAIGVAEFRERELRALGDRALATVVHPRASVSPHAQLGAGCFVAAQAVVAPSARLDVAVIVNHGAVVDHDVQVGAFCHVAPGAALGGGVRIGHHVLVGANASVLPGITVCDGVTLGAGAVLAAPVLEPAVFAGVPARRVR